MSDKSFTFFEFHFHDGFQVGPKTLPQFGETADTSVDTEESGEPEEPPDEAVTKSRSGSSLAPKLVGLGVLAAAAYTIRKLLSGGPSGLDALDDIEEFEDVGAEADSAEDNGVAIEVTSGEESESGSNAGLLVAAVVAVLLLVVLAARKLLGGDVEEVEIPDELAEG